MKCLRNKKQAVLTYAVMVLSVFLLLDTGKVNSDPGKLSVDVLNRPAMKSVRAETSVLLSVVRNGPRIVAVGERGHIVLSDNSGRSWQQVSVPVSVTLTKVKFAGPDDGWAIGHSGVILHTGDGGQTWERQMNGVRAAELVYQDTEARLKKAKDAGKTTETLERELTYAKLFVDDGPDKPFLDIYCKSDKEVFVIGAYGLMFKTMDGGKTWQPWMSRVKNPGGMHLYAMEKAGGNLLIVGEQGLILRSDDAGETFYKLSSPYDGTFFGLDVLETGEVIIYGLRGNAFISHDHGDHWTKLETGVKLGITACIESNDGRLYFTTQSGRILTSPDKGKTIKPLPIEESFAFSDLLLMSDRNLVLVGMRGIKVVSLGHEQTNAYRQENIIAYGEKR